MDAARVVQRCGPAWPNPAQPVSMGRFFLAQPSPPLYPGWASALNFRPSLPWPAKNTKKTLYGPGQVLWSPARHSPARPLFSAGLEPQSDSPARPQPSPAHCTPLDVAAVKEKSGVEVQARAYEASVQYIEELTSKCNEVQTKILAEILSQNADTEYLKRHGMPHGHVDREMFKTNVPVITYEDIKPDIIRIYNGDFSPILCAQPIAGLMFSSGTSSGQKKMIPITNDDLQRRYRLLTAVSPFLKKCIEGENPDKGKMLGLLLTRDETITPGGLVAQPGSNIMFKTPQFYNNSPYPYNNNTSPIEAIHCPDHFQSIYTQLLCGFYQRHDVTRVKVFFGSNLLWALNFLKAHYSDLCHDISSGNLNPKITDPSLRTHMVETFMQHPQPELAKFIESACIGENWEGILQTIWPNAKYIEAIITGSMSQYIPMLNYYSGGLPIVTLTYFSSECDFGYNLDPMCGPYDISYTLMPNMAYYEFIPLTSEDDVSGSQPEPVDMANVEVGQEYELVITTYTGLYRYRMADVICVIGFYNSTPQVKFVRRRDVVLSIDFEKTTESELHMAIQTASTVLQPFNTTILDYTSNSCTETNPGHYVIYLELITKSPENWHGLGASILEECCLAMEESLGFYYRSCRKTNCIGPLEIQVLSNGTFEKIMDLAISTGATFNQFKIPRCVKSLSMLELLDSRVVSSHFSPSMPHCRP
ncbi:indole-3-acetic acid-amido synthetase GH3.3-like [Silene latifolia]|uniref:indole-3-acetic acid-amido synthetase GH3.3-like n=1 Tax=Silene latifolia TaxID=37657 RepID=UPI003D789766